MRFLFFLLASFWFFRLEIYNYFNNISSLYVCLLLGVACIGIFILRIRINCSMVLFINKFRYFKFKKYLKTRAKLINKYNPELIGKFLANLLD